MFTIYLHNEFYIPKPSGPLVIAIKPKAKCRLNLSVMLLMHPLFYGGIMSSKPNYFSKVQHITAHARQSE